jgi:hypothetical protein
MDIQNILEIEKKKALTVITEYNIKYNTKDNKQLIELLNYLYKMLDYNNDNEIKNIIMDDINIIKEYL